MAVNLAVPLPGMNSQTRITATSKTLQTEDGQFEVDTPRYRSGNFEPQFVKNINAVSHQKYPQISPTRRTHWQNLDTLFSHPENIRKAIYITNLIESLNRVIRKVTKKRKIFPADESATKVIYFATQAASKKWTMPIRN